MPVKVVRVESDRKGYVSVTPGVLLTKNSNHYVDSVVVSHHGRGPRSKHESKAIFNDASEVPTAVEFNNEIKRVNSEIEDVKTHCSDEVSQSLKTIQADIFNLKKQLVQDLGFKSTIKNEMMKDKVFIDAIKNEVIKELKNHVL